MVTKPISLGKFSSWTNKGKRNFRILRLGEGLRLEEGLKIWSNKERETVAAAPWYHYICVISEHKEIDRYGLPKGDDVFWVQSNNLHDTYYTAWEKVNGHNICRKKFDNYPSAWNWLKRIVKKRYNVEVKP